jgi:hypothetical protein
MIKIQKSFFHFKLLLYLCRINMEVYYGQKKAEH